MVQCTVNFELGRVRIYDNDNGLDDYFTFDKDVEDSWKDVIHSEGYTESDLKIRVIKPTVKIEDKQEDTPNLLDILNTCAHKVREEKAGLICRTYIDSIRAILDGREVRVEPEIEEDWALCADNYPKGIVVYVSCSTEEEQTECLKRCKAFYEDLQMLYDNPAEIFMEVIK